MPHFLTRVQYNLATMSLSEAVSTPGDALTKYYSPNRGKIIAAQLSVATAIPFTIALLKVPRPALPCNHTPPYHCIRAPPCVVICQAAPHTVSSLHSLLLLAVHRQL